VKGGDMAMPDGFVPDTFSRYFFYRHGYFDEFFGFGHYTSISDSVFGM